MKGRAGILKIAVAAQDDKLAFRQQFLALPDKCQAIHERHFDIGHDDVGSMLPAETQPLFSVTGLVDVFKVHLQLSQGDDQSFSYDIFIFNNQKCHNLLRSLRNFSSCSFVGMETGREIVLQAPPKSEEENVKE